MKRIIYLSTATRDLSVRELEDIMAVSARNNERVGVTGLLIVKGRTFMQTLEGEDGAVDALYQRIAGDARHKDIIHICDDPISERQFPGWSMGFRNLAKLPPLESQKLVNFDRVDLASLANQPDLVREIFQVFIDAG